MYRYMPVKTPCNFFCFTFVLFYVCIFYSVKKKLHGCLNKNLCLHISVRDMLHFIVTEVVYQNMKKTIFELNITGFNFSSLNMSSKCTSIWGKKVTRDNHYCEPSLISVWKRNFTQCLREPHPEYFSQRTSACRMMVIMTGGSG